MNFLINTLSERANKAPQKVAIMSGENTFNNQALFDAVTELADQLKPFQFQCIAKQSDIDLKCS